MESVWGVGYRLAPVSLPEPATGALHEAPPHAPAPAATAPPAERPHGAHRSGAAPRWPAARTPERRSPARPRRPARRARWPPAGRSGPRSSAAPRRLPADQEHHARTPRRPRAGGCDHPDCVVPMCWLHHRAYDAGRLDLLGHLEPRWRTEIAHAVSHLGLISAYRRLTGGRLPAGDVGDAAL